MKANRSTVFTVLVIAAIEGLLAQELLLSRTIGLNGAILCFAGAALLAIAELAKKIDMTGYRTFVYSSLVIASIGFGITSSDGINLLNFAMLLLTMGYVAMRNQFARLPSLAQSLVLAPLTALLAPFFVFILKNVTPPATKKFKSLDLSTGTLMGLGLAVPALIVFGTIFAAADPMFSSTITLEFVKIPDSFGMRATIFGSTFVVAAGLMLMVVPQFKMALKPGSDSPKWAEPLFAYTKTGQIAIQGPPLPPKPAHDGTESTKAFVTFFALLGALFALFILVQARYLFGGSEVVLKTTGLTYAQYARRGFFELVTVIVLTLPMLLFWQEWLAKSSETNRAAVRKVVIAFSVMLLIILASAAYRMSLYVGAYGLSSARFYVYTAIVWLGCWVTAYAILGSKWKLPEFPKWVYATGMLVVLGCNLAKPDRLIASVNIRQPNVDSDLLSKLGEDAREVILASDNATIKTKYLQERSAFKFNWRDASLQEVLARR